MSRVISFSFLRSFRRFYGLIVLNITGLSLGLASVILIALWIGNELSYDRFFTDADRIYRVESLMNFTVEPFVWTVAPGPVAEAFLNNKDIVTVIGIIADSPSDTHAR
jgi:putative ABC transport system permease protein